MFNDIVISLNEFTKKILTLIKILKMKVDYQDFMIFFTFLLFWISIQFGQIVEDSIAFIIVLSLGIIHGSNDFTILKKQEKSKSLIKPILIYLLLIFCCVLSYIINPFISILLFVFLSSYHFGEQHLEDKLNFNLKINLLFYTFYGLFIFALIFIENRNDVDTIMLNLTGNTIPDLWIKIMLISSASILIGLYFYKVFKKIDTTLNIIRELFYLILLYLVFKTTSLILGFAIYFVLWHSIPSVLDQTKFLSGEKNKKAIFKYLKTALIYWVISISSLLLAYYYIEEKLFSSIIFLVLFAVTAPHVWVMNRMKK